jgi:biotin carboxylase
VIIEVNPRLAGGYIPELIRHAQNRDMILATLQATIGQQPQLQAERDHFASIRFLTMPDEGQMVQIDGIDEAFTVPAIVDIQLYKHRGDVVRVHGDFRDRLGHVIAAHPSPQVAITSAEQALKQVKLTLNPLRS